MNYTELLEHYTVEAAMKRRLFILSLFLQLTLFGQQSSNIVLLDHWTDTVSIPIAVEEARYSDLWAFQNAGSDFVAVGSSRGTEILQIMDNQMVHVAYEPGAFQGYTVVHRDFKVFQNYLYAVCDEGTSSLQIFDLNYLPDSLHKVYDSNMHLTICHNIFIDTSTAKLYACGPNNTGLKVLSLSDPENPTLDTYFTNVSYVHDCFVRNDTAYLNCGFDGLHIYNFAGTMPVQLGVIDFYANQGYNHSGWLSPSGTQYAFIDETEGTKIKLSYVNDLSAIQIDELFGPDEYLDYVPHNIVILEKLAFVAHYNLGLRVFDLSKRPIKEIAYFDTFLQETDYKLNGAWGVSIIEENNQILVCDRQNGIYLFSFPMDVLEASTEDLIVTSTPFIDENSRIIPRTYFDQEGLSFSIFSVNGTQVFNKEDLVNWMNIPLSLAAGTYAFAIYDSEKELLESGKFVKAN